MAKTMYGLTALQMREVYRHVRNEYIKDELKSFMEDGRYMLNGREFVGRDIMKHLDFDRIAENYTKADDFGYDLAEVLIETEIYRNRDSILNQ